MYVRFCATCARGFPLHLYEKGRKSCMSCHYKWTTKVVIESKARADFDASKHRWATREDALEIGPPRTDGLCRVATCGKKVQRSGDGPHAKGQAYPLCEEHLKVRLCCERVLRLTAEVAGVQMCAFLVN